MFDFIDCLEAEAVPGCEPERPLRVGGSRAGAAMGSSLWGTRAEEGAATPHQGAVAGIPPRPGRCYPEFVMDPRDKRVFSGPFSLLGLLRLERSGPLRAAGTLLNTLAIFDAWLFTRSSEHRLWFQRLEDALRVCSRTSWLQVHLLSMPYKLQRPYSKQGFISVCKGVQPLFSSSPGQTVWTVFTHIYLYNPLYLS